MKENANNGPTDLVGELYQGSEIHFRLDGWVNLTEMCSAFAKEAYEFLRLETTKEYIRVLEDAQVCSGISPEQKVVITDRARGRAGTWAHPMLALLCAQWLSPEFHIWCNEKVLRILRGEVVGGPAMDRLEAEARAGRYSAEAARLEAEVMRQKLLAQRALDLLGGVHVADWLRERKPAVTPLEIRTLSQTVKSYAWRQGHRLGKRFKRESSRMVPVYDPQTIAEALAGCEALGGKKVLELPKATT